MPTPPFTVSRVQPEEICIALHGALDEETALACEREVRTQLSLSKDGSLHVLWDLHELTSYTLDARAVLVRLQKFLASKASRTVYVAERPEPRSLALWAVHMAGHWHAHLSVDVETARAWLRGRDDTETKVKQLASVRPLAPSEAAPTRARRLTPRPPTPERPRRPTPPPFDKAAG